MQKTCKKCSVTKSGEVQYTVYPSRKVGVFVDADGQSWYGLECSTCHETKNPPSKRYRKPSVLGPRHAPAAPLHKCQECGVDTINRFNCAPCLDVLDAGDELTYSTGIQGFHV